MANTTAAITPIVEKIIAIIAPADNPLHYFTFFAKIFMTELYS